MADAPSAAAATRRLFFALWPPAPVVDTLFAEASRLATVTGGRVMRRDSLHLTLHFLGDVAETELPWIWRAAAAIQQPRFRFTIDTLGYWRHNRILWAGCSQPVPPLADLAATLAAGLRREGQGPGRSAFTPHLTLLRKANPPPPLDLAAPLEWPVDEFALLESSLTGNGARYTTLGRWPLL